MNKCTERTGDIVDSNVGNPTLSRSGDYLPRNNLASVLMGHKKSIKECYLFINQIFFFFVFEIEPYIIYVKTLIK